MDSGERYLSESEFYYPNEKGKEELRIDFPSFS